MYIEQLKIIEENKFIVDLLKKDNRVFFINFDYNSNTIRNTFKLFCNTTSGILQNITPFIFKLIYQYDNDVKLIKDDCIYCNQSTFYGFLNQFKHIVDLTIIYY